MHLRPTDRDVTEVDAMEKTRLQRIENKVAPRVDAIFWRVLWERDGNLFSTNPRKKDARPMNSREMAELEAEIDADPTTSLIVKHLPKTQKNSVTPTTDSRP
jgi:hypothetical protein